MAGVDRSPVRAIAVIALLFVVAWALRGYLPGIEAAAERKPSRGGSAALVIDVVLLSASVAIIGVAIVVRLRDRRARPPGSSPLPRRPGGIGRPTWRFSLIAFALVTGWLLLVLLLTRWGSPSPADHAPGGPPTIADSTAAPQPSSSPVPPQPDSPDGSAPNTIGYLVPPMLILLAMVVIGTAVLSRRQPRAAMSQPGVEDGSDAATPADAAESLARAAEVGLAEIGDTSRDPREAIIACYAAMERELAQVPGAVPLDCDTPSEVLARAVANHALRPDSATQLVDLFEEARFSPHVMNEGHRDMAVEALRLVLTELRSLV